MPYLHCTITLLMTDGSAITHGTGPVVTTKRPHAVYPWQIHQCLNGRFCTHYGRVPVRTPKRPHAVYPLCIQLDLTDCAALTHGPVPIVPKIRPHAVFHWTFTLGLTEEVNSLTGEYP